MNISNLRPGVYSSLTMSSRYATPRAQQHGALVCKGDSTLAGQLHTLRSLGQAEALLGNGSTNQLALSTTKILLESGVGQIYLACVTGEDYTGAFATLQERPAIGIILSDAPTPAARKAALASVTTSSDQGRERLLFLAEEAPEKAAELAAELNHARCIITCSTAYYSSTDGHPLYGAAALAGKILAENNPILLLHGAVLSSLQQVDPLPEAQLQHLLAHGVTPLEGIGDAVECVRGVTTKTTENQVSDLRLRSINTILIIDDVLRTVRSGLTARLRGMSLLGASLDSIASQVLVELSEKKEQHILTAYQVPQVYSLPEDPSVCVVELVFSVAHVITQIHIKAHVQL